MISAPLRSRFGIIERIDFYSDQDLQEIILQSAQFLKISISSESALLIGSCSRGTPRIAKKILRRVRDFAQVQHIATIRSYLSATSTLLFWALKKKDLLKLISCFLQKIIENFNGGPVGLETLAALIGEDTETIEMVYEPFLLRKGYLEKTARGRQIPHKKLPLLKQRFLGQHTLL